MNSLEKVLSAIGHSNCKQRGDSYDCKCPAHDDQTASLSVTYSHQTQSVLMHCHRGCKNQKILKAINLEERDLFDAPGTAPPALVPAQPKQKTRHAHHQQAIDAQRWSVEQNTGKQIAATIPYLYENGQPFGYSVRFNFVEGGKTFRQIHRDGNAWLSGAGDQLWCMYRLNDIQPDVEIYLHEGEKACEAGIQIGLCSTCCKGGCEAPHKTDWSPLAGRDVVILPDNDDAGEGFAATVTEILHQLDPPASVKIVRHNARPPKGGDLADIVGDCQDDDELIGLRQEVEDLAAAADHKKITAPKNSTAVEKSQQVKKSKRTLVTQCMADIQPREVEWLWEKRIPIGRLTLLTGPQGGTKSFLTVDLAARVSQGWKHPDGSGICPQGRTIFFTTEDDPSHHIVPRLQACGADLSQIEYIYGTTDDPDDDPDNACRLRLKTDMDDLEQTIAEMGDVKLLIFDPLQDYVDGDDNNNKEVRDALTQLKSMAHRQNIAVVAIHHINKRSKDVTAVQVAGGAGAWTQVPRSVLHVVIDPDDENLSFTRRRLVVVTKSNHGGTNEAQAYRLTEDKHPHIEWLPEILLVDSDKVIKASTQSDDGRKKRGQDKREAAYNDLRNIMCSGSLVSATEINSQMEKLGHSRRQIANASKELGLQKHKGAKRGDPWMWSLPEDEV